MNIHIKKLLYFAALCITLFNSCTKEDEFYKEDTVVGLDFKTTSPTKAFEIWVDDEMLQDSVSISKVLVRSIRAGERRLRIAQSGTGDFFVDTVLNFTWSTKSYDYTLIELEPTAPPLFFSGFPEAIPAAADGYVTLSFINTDRTALTKNRKIDLLIYDMGDANSLLAEFKNMPYNQISPYYKIPVDAYNNGGFVVIRDAENGELIFDGRNTWSTVYLGYYVPRVTGNTVLLKFSNEGDDTYPFFLAEPLFEVER